MCDEIMLVFVKYPVSQATKVYVIIQGKEAVLFYKTKPFLYDSFQKMGQNHTVRMKHM